MKNRKVKILRYQCTAVPDVPTGSCGHGKTQESSNVTGTGAHVHLELSKRSLLKPNWRCWAPTRSLMALSSTHVQSILVLRGPEWGGIPHTDSAGEQWGSEEKEEKEAGWPQAPQVLLRLSPPWAGHVPQCSAPAQFSSSDRESVNIFACCHQDDEHTVPEGAQSSVSFVAPSGAGSWGSSWAG